MHGFMTSSQTAVMKGSVIVNKIVLLLLVRDGAFEDLIGCIWGSTVKCRMNLKESLTWCLLNR